MKALLFINGNPPKEILDLQKYDIIACTDGAFNYLNQMGFPISKLNFVSGDFDSVLSMDENQLSNGTQWIPTPDQDFTDFHKALDILQEKGIDTVDVLGGSGGEMDHFLGNLSVAWRKRNELKIYFYDEFSEYYFIPNLFEVSGVKGKTISLYPFPIAKKVKTNGLNWPLDSEDLDITHRIGTRNIAKDDTISIRYESGGLLIFIENKAFQL